MQKSFLWNGLENDTEEHCAVNFLDKGIMVRSEIEGWVEGKPVYAEYVIKLDSLWNVMEFEIIFHISDIEHVYRLKRDMFDNWTDDKGNSYPEFSGCTYIDISLTPFTNTLPVNGLHLALGESRSFSLLYVDVMENELRRDTQTYTKLNDNTYRFVNDGGDFTADIKVDEDGFVAHYPGLFDMIKPK